MLSAHLRSRCILGIGAQTPCTWLHGQHYLRRESRHCVDSPTTTIHCFCSTHRRILRHSSTADLTQVWFWRVGDRSAAQQHRGLSPINENPSRSNWMDRFCDLAGWWRSTDVSLLIQGESDSWQ